MANTVDKQLQAMIGNMPEKTGKSLEQWIRLLKKSGLEKHGEILKLLKSEHGLTHGFANTISMLYREQAAGGPAAGDDLVAAQYAGAKAGLRPLYDKLSALAAKLGKDVEISPKKTYVSLRRSKQFAIIKPATKTRIDLGLNYKDAPASDRLGDGKPFNGMCSHCVRIEDVSQVDKELAVLLKQAYEQA